MSEPGDFVRLLEVDPDLGAGLEREVADRLALDSWVSTWRLTPGDWPGAERIPDGVAMYVIAGALARRVTVSGRSCVELLGAGQVLRPAVCGGEELVAATTSWQVLTQSWVAVLDQAFFRHMGGHPEVVVAVMDRLVLRVRSLALRLAVVGIRNLDQRLLVLLWHLADTYGRVRGEGVRLELVLSHGVLAELVSAQRSSVSVALKRLERGGLVSRGADRGFVLHGSAPARAAVAIS